ncbi:MAG: SDR family oxidoreductase [Burkholderiales bacterium]|nr:MAG: SDR family oxidoreductase [Burkholderiales bacterium]
MLTQSDMTGMVAIVTGAGSGLGRATAQTIRDKGRKVLELALNLTDRSNCTAVIDRTIAEFGRIDALCNVAGVLSAGPSTTFPEDEWDLIIKVNLEAPFFLSRAAIPHMLENGGGIVNVSSSASFKAQAYFTAYCASKAGLSHVTRSMALEYIKTKVRINAVAPGGMQTPLAGNVGRAITEGDPELFGRLGTPRGFVEIDDVAGTVAFLASPAAAAFHGSVISVDGGEIIY